MNPLPKFFSVALALVIPAPFPASLLAADWPQWGGTQARNMVSTETGLPESFSPGEKKGEAIDPATSRNVRWVAKLGAFAYGNPTIAGGKVFIGTDGRAVDDDPRFDKSHAGVVKCLNEADGSLVWQLVVPDRTHGLPDSVHFGLQKFGVCSSTRVDRDRAYVVTSAGDIVCLDVNGLADGNDGPFQDEGQYMAGHGKPPLELSPQDADIVWRFDPIDELKVCPHDAVSCSLLIDGDVLYTGTSNGVGGDKGSHWTRMHDYVVNPGAPAFIALDKHTGRLVAVENAGISSRLWHAQWSSPSLGVVNGEKLVFLGGGDGYCYAFKALTKLPDEGGKPVPLELAWKYDGNPPEYRCPDGEPVDYYKGDKRQSHSTNKDDGQYVGPSQVIATPVFHDNRVYIAIGQDPAHGRGRGMLHCIDATGTGDITGTGRLWSYDGIERTMSTAAVRDGLVYIPDVSGKIHCLDAGTGEACWVHDMATETWGSTLVADGRLYVGNKRHLCVFTEGREPPRKLSEIPLRGAIYSTPVAANGVLYVSNGRSLWAVAQAAGEPAPKSGSEQTYRARKVDKTAIQIDGRAGESEWADAVVEREFFFPWKKLKAPPTAFRAVWDRENFYFAFQVRDDDVVVEENFRGEEDAVFEDRVELYFSLDEAMKKYFCFEIDSRGRVFDYGARSYREFDPKWNLPELETAATRQPDGYEVEGKIPLESFAKMGFPPIQPGAKIRFGMFRAEFSHDRSGKPVKQDSQHTLGRQHEGPPPIEAWISWVDPKTDEPDFHVPASLGWLEFGE